MIKGQLILLIYEDSLMHYNYVWHIKSIYPTKFQVNSVTHIEVIRQNVFSHARVMVIGVSSYLNNIVHRASYSALFQL